MIEQACQASSIAGQITDRGKRPIEQKNEWPKGPLASADFLLLDYNQLVIAVDLQNESSNHPE